MSEPSIRSVQRALSILEAFHPHDEGVTLSEIARRTELNKMTAMRLLGTLEGARFVERLPTGGYRLGGAVMQLAQVFSASLKLEEYVVPSLQRIAGETGESAAYYRREMDFRVCMFRVDSKHRVRAQTRVGDRVPLPKGAYGRVLVRFSDSQLCSEAGPAVVISYADNDPELATVAAPVFDFSSTMIGSIGVSLPIYRFSEDIASHLSTVVLREAQSLTERLGGDIPLMKAARPTERLMFEGKTENA